MPEGFGLAVIIAAESEGSAGANIKLGGLETCLLEGILPDEEDFVDGAQSVDFELIVTIAAINEKFDIVFIEDEGIALRERRLNERLFHPKSDVEVLIVPKGSGTGIEITRIAGDHVAKARRAGGARPRVFGEVSVYDDGRRSAEAEIFGRRHIQETYHLAGRVDDKLTAMADKNATRRSFLAAGSAAPAAAAAVRSAVVQPPVIVTDAKAERTPLRIVTRYPFEPFEVEKIKAAAPKAQVEMVICQSREDFMNALPGAEVVYGDIRADGLAVAPKLKWLMSGGAGMEGMDKVLKDSAVVVTNYQRTFAHGITETAMGLLLCLTRGITTLYMPQFAKRQMVSVGTPKSADHTELVGRTMGIVGMGGIGTLLAKRAHYGFDMRVIATDAKPVPKPEYVAELHDPTYFHEMAAKVDVLVAAAPHTPLTERMFNEQVFRSMKPTAYFLALSRGMLYDDMALVKALKEGWIKGAGLDVFPIEPPPADHPIFDCKNVVMTAHTSGWSPDRQIRLIDVFAENVRRYTEGLPLVGVVDKQRGY